MEKGWFNKIAKKFEVGGKSLENEELLAEERKALACSLSRYAIIKAILFF